jgi:hypothetical protein
VSIEDGSGNPLGTVTVLKRKNGRDDRGGLDRSEATVFVWQVRNR